MVRDLSCIGLNTPFLGVMACVNLWMSQVSNPNSREPGWTSADKCPLTLPSPGGGWARRCCPGCLPVVLASVCLAAALGRQPRAHCHGERPLAPEGPRSSRTPHPTACVVTVGLSCREMSPGQRHRVGSAGTGWPGTAVSVSGSCEATLVPHPRGWVDASYFFKLFSPNIKSNRE